MFFWKKDFFLGLLIVVVVVGLLGSGFAIGFKAGQKVPHTILVEGVTGAASGQPGDVDFGTFWQAWSVISENYLNDKDVSNTTKLEGSIGGLVNSLGDPYSAFFNPSDNKKFQEDIQGNFSGIGAEIGTRKGQLVIIAPLKGSPAERAGLKAEDKILLINASSTEGITTDQAVRLIRGPEKTVVKLTIFRDSWDAPKEISITRENIVAPTLDFTMKDGKIAYIQLYSFNANAERLFFDAMVKALGQGAKGMVLDLRNDPGGYLEVAVQLAGWFFPRGTLVVSEVGRAGPLEEFRANGNAALKDFPVVVLINNGSASASEILAGALRDNRKIKLIGEKSFGKGSVQQLIPLRDESSLKITVAHWVLPNGAVLEKGLDPDIEVKLTDEDTENKRDPQLDRALEEVKKIAG